nr:hypothetical protein [Tanacetum cinerariifolium]
MCDRSHKLGLTLTKTIECGSVLKREERVSPILQVGGWEMACDLAHFKRNESPGTSLSCMSNLPKRYSCLDWKPEPEYWSSENAASIKHEIVRATAQGTILVVEEGNHGGKLRKSIKTQTCIYACQLIALIVWA